MIIVQDNNSVVEGSFLGIPVWRQSGWRRSRKMPIAAVEDWLQISHLLYQYDSVIFSHTRAHGRGGTTPANDVVDEAAGSACRRKPNRDGFPYFGLIEDFPTEKNLLEGLPYVNIHPIVTSSFSGHEVLSSILQSIYPPNIKRSKNHAFFEHPEVDWRDWQDYVQPPSLRHNSVSDTVGSAASALVNFNTRVFTSAGRDTPCHWTSAEARYIPRSDPNDPSERLLQLFDPVAKNFYDTILHHYEPNKASEHTAFSKNTGCRNSVLQMAAASHRLNRMLVPWVKLQFDVRKAYDHVDRSKIREDNHLDVRAGLLNPLAGQILDRFYSKTLVCIDHNDNKWVSTETGTQQGFGPSCRIFRRRMQRIGKLWRHLESLPFSFKSDVVPEESLSDDDEEKGDKPIPREVTVPPSPLQLDIPTHHPRINLEQV